jgi:hypothetical protein
MAARHLLLQYLDEGIYPGELRELLNDRFDRDISEETFPEYLEEFINDSDNILEGDILEELDTYIYNKLLQDVREMMTPDISWSDDKEEHIDDLCAQMEKSLKLLKEYRRK